MSTPFQLPTYGAATPPPMFSLQGFGGPAPGTLPQFPGTMLPPSPDDIARQKLQTLLGMVRAPQPAPYQPPPGIMLHPNVAKWGAIATALLGLLDRTGTAAPALAQGLVQGGTMASQQEAQRRMAAIEAAKAAQGADLNAANLDYNAAQHEATRAAAQRQHEVDTAANQAFQLKLKGLDDIKAQHTQDHTDARSNRTAFFSANSVPALKEILGFFQRFKDNPTISALAPSQNEILGQIAELQGKETDAKNAKLDTHIKSLADGYNGGYRAAYAQAIQTTAGWTVEDEKIWADRRVKMKGMGIPGESLDPIAKPGRTTLGAEAGLRAGEAATRSQTQFETGAPSDIAKEARGVSASAQAAYDKNLKTLLATVDSTKAEVLKAKLQGEAALAAWQSEYALGDKADTKRIYKLSDDYDAAEVARVEATHRYGAAIDAYNAAHRQKRPMVVAGTAPFPVFGGNQSAMGNVRPDQSAKAKTPAKSAPAPKRKPRTQTTSSGATVTIGG